PRKGPPSELSAATGRRDACRRRSRRPARTGAGSIVAQHRAWLALLERSSREAEELDKLDRFARRALRDHPDPRRGFRHYGWRQCLNPWRKPANCDVRFLLRPAVSSRPLAGILGR